MLLLNVGLWTQEGFDVQKRFQIEDIRDSNAEFVNGLREIAVSTVYNLYLVRHDCNNLMHWPYLLLV